MSTRLERISREQALLQQPGDLAPGPPQTAQPGTSHRHVTSLGFPSATALPTRVAQQSHSVEDDMAVSLALVPWRDTGDTRRDAPVSDSSLPAGARDKASAACAQAVPVLQALTQGIPVCRGGHEAPSCDTCAWRALEPCRPQARGEEQLPAGHSAPPSSSATTAPPSSLLHDHQLLSNATTQDAQI